MNFYIMIKTRFMILYKICLFFHALNQVCCNLILLFLCVRMKCTQTDCFSDVIKLIYFNYCRKLYFPDRISILSKHQLCIDRLYKHHKY